MVDLRAWRAGFEVAQFQAFWFTVSALAMFLLVWALTPTGARHLQYALLVVGSGLAGLLVGQVAVGLEPNGFLFGSPRYAAALLAVVAPLSPARLLPIFGAGLAAAQSYLALLAAGIGLLMRWGHRSSPWLPPAIVVGAIAIFVLRDGPSGPPWPVWQTRVEAHSLALADLTEHPWIGFGPAGWITTVPFRQMREGQTDLFAQPHSELLGWVYEEGLVGLVLLIGWVASNARTFWASDVAGSIVALAVLAVGLHVFHVAALAPWMVLVMALGLREPRHA